MGKVMKIDACKPHMSASVAAGYILTTLTYIMKATGFFLGYLCWYYYVVWELSRYRGILAKANEMRSFTVDFRWKKKTSRSVSWIVWSSKPWRDNWYKQWRYFHLEWVIQWILYSRTLKKTASQDSYLYLAEDSVLTNGKKILKTCTVLTLWKKKTSSIHQYVETWKCAIEL